MPCHDILFQRLSVGALRDEQGIVEGDIASGFASAKDGFVGTCAFLPFSTHVAVGIMGGKPFEGSTWNKGDTVGVMQSNADLGCTFSTQVYDHSAKCFSNLDG